MHLAAIDLFELGSRDIGDGHVFIDNDAEDDHGDLVVNQVGLV